MTKNKLNVLCLVLLLAGIPVAHGSDSASHAQCVIDYNLGNYQRALSSCANALSGEHDEQIANYLLGELYGYGKGVGKDQEKAFQYYLRSANAGYPPAQLNVGHYYAENARAKESVRWYLRAGSEEWDGAAYALSRAADMLSGLQKKYDAYKCLYASEQLGYKANANEVGKSLGAEEKERAEKEALAWLKDRKQSALVTLCEDS